MARDRGETYFLHLQQMAGCAYRAGQAIQKSLSGAQTLQTADQHVQAQCEQAQQEMDTMTHALEHAFITPMERENLYQLGEGMMALMYCLCTWSTSLALLDGKAMRAVLVQDAAQIQAILQAVEQAMQALPDFSHAQRALSQRLLTLQKQLRLARTHMQTLLRQWALRPMDKQTLHLYVLIEHMQRIQDEAQHIYTCIHSAVLQNT